MKMVKELSKKTNSTHRHRQQYGDYYRGRAVGEVGEGIVEINGDGRRLYFGW